MVAATGPLTSPPPHGLSGATLTRLDGPPLPSIPPQRPPLTTPTAPQEFCMQLDSHSDVLPGWDGALTAMWGSAGNEYAVLSTAVPDLSTLGQVRSLPTASPRADASAACPSSFDAHLLYLMPLSHAPSVLPRARNRHNVKDQPYPTHTPPLPATPNLCTHSLCTPTLCTPS